MRTQNPERTTSINWAAAIEGCLLVGIGAMLLRKTVDGHLPLYIHPRYVPLVLLTALVTLLLGVFRLWQISAEMMQSSGVLRGRVGLYGLLLTPLLLGVLIPARPAGSALVDARMLNPTGRGYRGTNLLASDDSAKWTLFEWMVARATLKPAEVKGNPVDVIGFVYRSPEQPQDEFFVVRYTLACCIADRSSVALLVLSNMADNLANDQWVRVAGTIDIRETNHTSELIVTNAQITPIEQPKEPYLYP